MTTEFIAILGWGSLLWEGGEEFNAQHEPWQFDGPSLKIEFSRVSKSRLGALTLVIDPDNRALSIVAYCLSRRREIDSVISDLRKREAARIRDIGYFCANGTSRFHNKPSFEAISVWATTKGVSGVVWTDLESNFSEKAGKTFSVEAALAYLSGLEGEAKAKAEEYLQKAPDFVQTPLLQAWRKQVGIDSDYKPC